MGSILKKVNFFRKCLFQYVINMFFFTFYNQNTIENSLNKYTNDILIKRKQDIS